VQTLDAETLRATFDAPSEPTIGVEEEVMVLDGETLDLAPRAADVLAAAQAPPLAALKPELVAAQLEIASPPVARVGDAVASLAAGRRALAAAAEGLGLRLACAAAHPFADVEGELAPGQRYDAIAAEYGVVARRQLVYALQVHVAVRGAERALAVYNALRSHLPELAALAAAAPFHGGRDTGLASVRPTIAEQLPRQGMPPALASWEAFADALAAVGDAGQWWWELRPHPLHGTLEIRVPDVQATVAEAGAIVAVAHALAVWLAERFDAGERLEVEETWRIEERRWAAVRHGPRGALAERIAALLDAIDPTAARLGCAAQLADARRLLAAGGPAARLRACGSPQAAARWLCDRFLEGV
jgi:carboxylate-amine ligase